MQQNFFSSLEVINEENKKHSSDCDDVDKNSFAWPRKFKPTASFKRKMFEINHIYSEALFDILVNCPSSGKITYQFIGNGSEYCVLSQPKDDRKDIW